MYFQKVISQGGGVSGEEKNSEKAENLGICPSFSGTVGDAQFQKCPVSPPLNYGYCVKLFVSCINQNRQNMCPLYPIIEHCHCRFVPSTMIRHNRIIHLNCKLSSCYFIYFDHYSYWMVQQFTTLNTKEIVFLYMPLVWCWFKMAWNKDLKKVRKKITCQT